MRRGRDSAGPGSKDENWLGVNRGPHLDPAEPDRAASAPRHRFPFWLRAFFLTVFYLQCRKEGDVSGGGHLHAPDAHVEVTQSAGGCRKARELLHPHQRREAQCGESTEQALFLAQALTGCDMMPAISLHHLQTGKINFLVPQNSWAKHLTGQEPGLSTGPRGQTLLLAFLRFSEHPSGTVSMPSLAVALSRFEL